MKKKKKKEDLQGIRRIKTKDVAIRSFYGRRDNVFRGIE